MRYASSLIAVLFASGILISAARPPDIGDSVETIIQKSVEANQRDWNADPEYSYTEATNTGGPTKTYEVTMLFGSTYHKLIAVDGKPLSPGEQQHEQAKFDQAVTERKSESAAARRKRIAKYQRERQRDYTMMQQLTTAFNFKPHGEATVDGREVYVLDASPKPEYRPANTDSRVLTGMRGTVWIDKATYQWVKVRAEVVSPVNISGFLARVEPGTWFELEKAPVTEDIWLTKRFSMRSHARVLGMFSHNGQETTEFSNYHKTPPQYVLNHGG